MLDWMKQKIHECDLKEYTIPRFGVRHHRQIDKGLGCVFREFEETSKLANTLYPDTQLDEEFQEMFSELRGVKNASKKQYWIG
jgi:hypothetical protein